MLIKLGRKHMHQEIQEQWLQPDATVPRTAPWWVKDPCMARRRELVLNMKRSNRESTPKVINEGYFDF